MYRFAFSMMKNEADAQDVLQEVFINVWEKRNRITIDCNWKVYLMQAVRNRCLDMLKKQKKLSEMSIVDDNQFKSTQDVQSHYEQKELLLLVEQQIKKLPAREQRILYLKEYEQLSYDDIAHIEQVSVLNVRTILSRTKKILKKEMPDIYAYLSS